MVSTKCLVSIISRYSAVYIRFEYVEEVFLKLYRDLILLSNGPLHQPTGYLSLELGQHVLKLRLRDFDISSDQFIHREMIDIELC
jgi:hypothetical protein